MANPKLEPLFADLDQFLEDGDYEQGLVAAEKSTSFPSFGSFGVFGLVLISCGLAVLKIVPDDADAFACQYGCLIQLGSIEKAFELLEKKGGESTLLDRAYCLYRLKRYPEAVQLVQTLPTPRPTRALELEAQLVCPRLPF